MDIEVLFLVYFANVISWHFTRALIVTLTAPELHIWLMSGPRHRTEGEIDIRTHFYFSHFPNLPNTFSRPRVCREEFCREQTNVRPAQTCLWGSCVPFYSFCLRPLMWWMLYWKLKLERLLQTLRVCLRQHLSKKLSLRVWGKCLDIGWKCQGLIKTVFVSSREVKVFSVSSLGSVLKWNRHFQSGHFQVDVQAKKNCETFHFSDNDSSRNWLILWLY